MTHDYTNPRLPKNERNVPVPRDELDFDHPPRGVTMERTAEGGVVIRTRLFSSATMFFIVFALFWNGIVSVFVCCAVVLTCRHFDWDVPGFLSFFKEGTKDEMPWWGLWLFLTPFIAVGVGMAIAALRGVFGTCVIRVANDEGSVYTGVGPLGRTQRFHPQSVKRSSLRDNGQRLNGVAQHSPRIEMNNGREITLPNLGPLRNTWIAFALRVVFGLPGE
jgi:hypothetical protein